MCWLCNLRTRQFAVEEQAEAVAESTDEADDVACDANTPADMQKTSPDLADR